jgi:hypothetical protein
MATPADLTGAHYRAQLAIKAHAVRTSHSLWSTWDGEQGTWARLLDLSVPVLGALHKLSGQAARDYYSQLAAHAIGRAEKALPISDLPHEQVVRSLTATGLVGTFAAHSRGKSEQAARQIGFVKFSGSFSRLALLGSRSVLVQTVQASDYAKAWQRVTSGSACDFCAGLAGQRTTSDTFEAHDHCSCTAEPLFS